FNDFFRGFRHYGPLLLLSFLMHLVIIGCLLFYTAGVAYSLAPGGRPESERIAAATLGFLLSLGLIVYFTTRWAFAGLLVLDQRMGAVEALATSWRLTRGKVM